MIDDVLCSLMLEEEMTSELVCFKFVGVLSLITSGGALIFCMFNDVNFMILKFYKMTTF